MQAQPRATFTREMTVSAHVAVQTTLGIRFCIQLSVILYTAVRDSVLSGAGVTGRAVSHIEELLVAIVAVDKQ